MNFELKTVFDPEFKPYGKIAEHYEVKQLTDQLNEITPKPEAGTVYVPSDSKLEELSIFAELSSRCYGGMPIQIGYCNGTNTMWQQSILKRLLLRLKILWKNPVK